MFFDTPLFLHRGGANPPSSTGWARQLTLEEWNTAEGKVLDVQDQVLRRTVASSFLSLWVHPVCGEAKSHAVKALQRPRGEVHMVKSQASHQQPCEWILEVGPPASSESHDACHPGQHLNCIS